MTQTNDVGDLLNAINSIEISKRRYHLLNQLFRGRRRHLHSSQSSSTQSETQIKQKPETENHCFRWTVSTKHLSLKIYSPLREDESHFEELGQRLKRNNVAVDVINFAHPENVEKLQALITAANNNNNSHFLDVPIGVAMITDVLIASPIINPEEEMGPSGAAPTGAAAGAGAPARAT